MRYARPKTSRREFLGRSGGLAGLLAISGASRLAEAAEPNADELISKGVAFLKTRQGEDGGWSTEREPGITALVVAALLRSRRITAADPIATRALAYLQRFLGPDGLIGDVPHSNYSVSIALLAFAEADKAPGSQGRYSAIVKAGQAFLKAKQWDESEGKSRDSDFYGGAGYGGTNSRPDLSNTAFMIEALRESGLPADDPALKKALIFVSRSQNLKSEFNDRPWADRVDDGGFVYTPANGGSSVAGKTENGGLRSYASMTYAGLKSMIHAGLSQDDPRVKAAVSFIKKHYSLDENPGLGQLGLYYYYHTFAKALAMLGKPTLVDDQGIAHDWRAELVRALAKRQNRDGSWVNKADRFMEGDPNLVTAYALLALIQAKAETR